MQFARAIFGRCLDHLARRIHRRLADIDRENRLARNCVLLQSAKRVGRNVRLNGDVTVSGINALEIGDNVDINTNAWIRAEGGVTIGSHTKISRNLVLYSTNHNWEGPRLPYDETVISKSVSIGQCVWIGMNVCITPGSSIGDGAIIGMGTVVSGEVPAGAILVGQKARVIGYRDMNEFQRLSADGEFAGVRGFPMSDDDGESLAPSTMDARAQ